MFLQVNKVIQIASIGMLDEQVGLFKKFLKDFAKEIDSKWLYIGNFDPTETINTMGSGIEAEYLMIDIDDELGKRVWYFLSALRDENKTIAYTREPWTTDAKLVIKKPLYDYKIKKSLFDFSKEDMAVEVEQMIKLLNTLDNQE